MTPAVIIEALKRELDARNEELRRKKDHIIMSLTQRIPELEAAPEPREEEDPETASEERAGTPGPSEDTGQENRCTSWWRKLFSG